MYSVKRVLDLPIIYSIRPPSDISACGKNISYLPIDQIVEFECGKQITF
jgi:hypothetical protein